MKPVSKDQFNVRLDQVKWQVMEQVYRQVSRKVYNQVWDQVQGGLDHVWLRRWWQVRQQIKEIINETS